MKNYTFPELRVLVGEDYEIIRDILGQFFEFLNVKRIDIVEDGGKTIFYAMENEYDLILLDINMPVKNGFEVIQERRHFKGNPLVVALTANTQQKIRDQCKALGMDDFLTKPVEWKDIVHLLLTHFKDKALIKDAP